MDSGEVMGFSLFSDTEHYLFMFPQNDDMRIDQFERLACQLMYEFGAAENYWERARPEDDIGGFCREVAYEDVVRRKRSTFSLAPSHSEFEATAEAPEDSAGQEEEETKSASTLWNTEVPFMRYQ